MPIPKTMMEVAAHNARVAAGKKKHEADNNNSGLCPKEHGKPTPPLAADCERKTQGRGCPVVRITVCRKRLLDVDAKFAAVKFILDGIVATGIVAGDKEGQITLECPQRKAGKGEREQTVIEITELTPDKTDANADND